jgi:hypothetical protein
MYPSMYPSIDHGIRRFGLGQAETVNICETAWIRGLRPVLLVGLGHLGMADWRPPSPPALTNKLLIFSGFLFLFHIQPTVQPTTLIASVIFRERSWL